MPVKGGANLIKDWAVESRQMVVQALAAHMAVRADMVGRNQTKLMRRMLV